MLSQGLGVYHMANQITSIGRIRKTRVLAQGKLQTSSAVPGDSSYPNRRLSNIIHINFPGELFRPLFTGNFRGRMLKAN
jgi:hypothetical protein